MPFSAFPASLDPSWAASSQTTCRGDGGKGTSRLHVRRDLNTADAHFLFSFYINLPIGGAALALVTIFFHAPSASRPAKVPLLQVLGNLDVLGLLLIIAAFVIFLLDMQWAGTTKPWSAGEVVGTLVACGILMLLFVGNEIWLGERALMVPRIMKQRIMTSCNLYILL